MASGWALRAEPRAWQTQALERWEHAGNRGVVAIVTGGGKTIFAYLCMLSMQRQESAIRVTVIVPTLALLDQWFVGFTEDLNVPADEIAAFSGRSKQAPRAVNIMVLNTARSMAPPIAQGHPHSMLVVDECHRAASEENVRSLQGDYQATLGLSATPEREFDDLFQERVVPALGPILYTYGYDDASRDQIISPFALINVEVPLETEEQSTYDRLTRQAYVLFRRRERGEDVEGRLASVLRQRSRVSNGAALRIPTTIKILSQHQRQRTLVFHEQIDAANVITEALRQQGHRVAAYHSGLGSHLRQDNLRLFRRGHIDVLVTCRALDEGINVPDASMALIAASTSSTRQRIQRLGRVLRPAPGKTSAEIYTLYASQPEAERLRREEAGLLGVRDVHWQRMVVG